MKSQKEIDESLHADQNIVRSMIEIHGGTIRTENLTELGARFCFRLPATRKQQSQTG